MIKTWIVFTFVSKKIYITDKRSEAIRKPTLFFLNGAVWFQRMGFPSWIQSVWSWSWLLSSPRSCLWLRQHAMMKRVEWKVLTELQRWSLINQFLKVLGAHTEVKGSQNYQYKRKTCSLNCTHRASSRVNSSWHGFLVVVYNICLHHSLS